MTCLLDKLALMQDLLTLRTNAKSLSSLLFAAQTCLLVTTMKIFLKQMALPGAGNLATWVPSTPLWLSFGDQGVENQASSPVPGFCEQFEPEVYKTRKLGKTPREICKALLILYSKNSLTQAFTCLFLFFSELTGFCRDETGYLFPLQQ